MNPPKPSKEAVNESMKSITSITPLTNVTTIDLSINPTKWLPNRLERIQKHSKTKNYSVHTSNEYDQYVVQPLFALTIVSRINGIKTFNI